jgi:hypothetical protein
MMYSKEEQRKDREKFSNIKPGGSAEVRWGEKHEPSRDGTALVDAQKTDRLRTLMDITR